MEEDPSFKQLIPYVLFRWTDDDGTVQLFQYQRGGGMGERRLHAKRSVGVGGHISSLDAAAGHLHHVYREGMQRELAEEVAIDTPYTETIVGLINDDETPVGTGPPRRRPPLRRRTAARRSPARPTSSTPASARSPRFSPRLDEFETWSQIVVRALFG